MDKALLSVRRLHKIFSRAGKSIEALTDVNFDLRQSDVIGLLGPNGSGKTSLIKALVGLCVPDYGEICWVGLSQKNHSYLSEIGVLLEGRVSINERLSTLENAKYYCALREKPFDSLLFKGLADILNMGDVSCPLRYLSTGTKARSSLLLALIHKPSVALLDEPTIGLDIFGIERLNGIIKTMSALDCAFILCSHDLDFVEKICKRIICLRSGRIVFDGDLAEFRNLEYLYKVSIELGIHKYKTQEINWPNLTFFGGGGDIMIRDHVELCRFLRVATPHMEFFQSLEISKLTLREKYMSLVKSDL